MKHSKETKGFSSDSFPSALSSTFRPSSSAGTLRGDRPVLLADAVRLRSFLVRSVLLAGDGDLRPEFSPKSRRTPLLPAGIHGRFTGILLAGENSDLFEGDLPARSLRPETGRLRWNFAGDAVSLNRIPTSSSSSPLIVVAEMLSLKLQISERSEAASPLLM